MLCFTGACNVLILHILIARIKITLNVFFLYNLFYFCFSLLKVSFV